MKLDGLKIWKVMTEIRLTKADLSRAAGLRERTLTRAMAGFNINPSKATRIAEALQLPLGEIRRKS